MSPGEVEVKVGLPLGRQPGDIQARRRFEGLPGVPEVGGDAHGVDLDVRGAELGVEVVAVNANPPCDRTCDVDVRAGLCSVVFPGGDDGQHEIGGAEQRHLLGWTVGVAHPIGQRLGGGGRHMLREPQALQPKEGMSHAEQSGDDLQGLTGVFTGPNGAVSGDPGRFGVIDLGEGRGSRLVGNRQQPIEPPAPGALGPANGVLELGQQDCKLLGEGIEA
jgi:hypothetical protein